MSITAEPAEILYGTIFNLDGEEYRVCGTYSYDCDEIQVKGPHQYVAVLHPDENGMWRLGDDRKWLLPTWGASTLDALEICLNQETP